MQSKNFFRASVTSFFFWKFDRSNTGTLAIAVDRIVRGQFSDCRDELMDCTSRRTDDNAPCERYRVWSLFYYSSCGHNKVSLNVGVLTM